MRVRVDDKDIALASLTLLPYLGIEPAGQTSSCMKERKGEIFMHIDRYIHTYIDRYLDR